jgi:transposase
MESLWRYAHSATILWGDETGVQNQSNQGRSFAPKSQTPEIRKVGKKLRVNMISTVSNRGKVRFMIYEGKMNQKLFIDFLKRLIASNVGKVFLILDNLPVHHGKIVKEWVSLNHENIELFFIPSYSPELNPDEYLNRDLKKNVNASRAPRNISELKQNLTSFMRKLQKSPARFLKYFNSSWIQYAATLSDFYLTTGLIHLRPGPRSALLRDDFLTTALATPSL